ncbi:hypothetical protein [Methylomonas sp. ZR1]|uniref:hypothetical protein n=1 Tax=Methylomonas sp. ZR1 TaxID=1797072 RepID=UPI0014929EEE|nr:hypothetical protein [Methylomonas sp. ZR1]NOV29199.1 hypothetical protein [Methylomonas sp. ZR1]
MTKAKLPEHLSQAEVAELMDVNKHMLSKAIPYLPGFPKTQSVPGQAGNFRRYSRKQILAWCKNRDVKKEVSIAGSQARAGQSNETDQRFNAACRLFITGAYVGPTQRNRIALKKIAARQCYKPGKRLIITIVPDWMQDQRGYNEPQTKIIERTV